MRETGKLSPNKKEAAAAEEEEKAGNAGGGVVTQWGMGLPGRPARSDQPQC